MAFRLFAGLSLVAFVTAQNEADSLSRPVKGCVYLDDKCSAPIACTESQASGLCEPLPGVPGIVFGDAAVLQTYHHAIHRGENVIEVAIFGNDVCDDVYVSPTEIQLELCTQVPEQAFYIKVMAMKEGETVIDGAFNLEEGFTAGATAAAAASKAFGAIMPSSTTAAATMAAATAAAHMENGKHMEARSAQDAANAAAAAMARYLD